MLPVFAVMSVVLLGGAALLTDVAWWWVNEQRMQRAADAGALAGAIHLPGNEALAFSRAYAEAAKNGFVNGVAGVTVTPKRDPDPRKLIVEIDGPVATNFARVFAMESVPVSVAGAASFVAPVPMGSPQNYYGVGYLRDAVTTTTSIDHAGATGWDSPTAFVSGGDWSRPWLAFGDGYTTASGNDDKHDWRNFGLLAGVPDEPGLRIDGIRVRLRSTALTGSGERADCRISARLSPDGGASWSAPLSTQPLTTSDEDYELGSATDTSVWGGRTWSRADLRDSAFLVRLAWHDGTAGCASSRDVRVGEIEVQVTYGWTETTTSVSIEEVDVRSPEGDVLPAHGFWGALQSQGAPNIQGDAYLTYYDTRTSRSNDDYTPESYYQYEIEYPAGSSGGEVWLFDPGFCHVDRDKGTGEYYTIGGSNGTSFSPVSTFYDLYDTHDTPYDTSDDTLVYSSAAEYRRLALHDSVLDILGSGYDAPGGTARCDDVAWHNDWVRIADGLGGGRTYRLHTHSTDASDPGDQRAATGLNAFSIWATARGGTPRVHGLGAMEAYVRLPGGRSSEFYLAQIDAEHAGKTMVIKLWDPGDTGNLAANLQILEPTAIGYQATTFDFSAERNSGSASSCDHQRGVGISSVITNTGGSSLYNGCWLTIEIPLGSDYSAPLPASDTVASEGGWWKIRYNMSGRPDDYSTDLTTWEVTLRGNPVHLVLD